MTCLTNLVKAGYVRRDEIVPQLAEVGMTHIDPDDVAGLVRKHRFGGGTSRAAKLFRPVLKGSDQLASLVFALVGAALAGEVAAARIFSGTILNGKLQGFGDHFLYWLGQRSIVLSGPEMLQGMSEVVAATPDIVAWMVIGGVVGVVAWKVGRRLVGRLVRRRWLRRDMSRLLMESRAR